MEMTAEDKYINSIIDMRLAPLEHNIARLVDDVSKLKLPNTEAKPSRTNELLNAIGDLIEKWEIEGGYLNNPHDHAEDRAGGRVYQECAKALKQITSGI